MALNRSQQYGQGWRGRSPAPRQHPTDPGFSGYGQAGRLPGGPGARPPATPGGGPFAQQPGGPATGGGPTAPGAPPATVQPPSGMFPPPPVNPPPTYPGMGIAPNQPGTQFGSSPASLPPESLPGGALPPSYGQPPAGQQPGGPGARQGQLQQGRQPGGPGARQQSQPNQQQTMTGRLAPRESAMQMMQQPPDAQRMMLQHYIQTRPDLFQQFATDATGMPQVGWQEGLLGLFSLPPGDPRAADPRMQQLQQGLWDTVYGGLQQNPAGPPQGPLPQQPQQAAPQPQQQPGVGHYGPGSWQRGGQQQPPAQQPQQQAQPQQAQQAPQAPAQQPGGIQTSVQPSQMYPSQYIQQAGNMAHAQGVPARQDIMPQSAQGVSQGSPANQWQYGTNLGQALSGAAMAPQQVGQQLGFANAQNQLAQQQMRSQEALGWGGLGVQGYQNMIQNQLTHQGSLLGLLGGASRLWR